MCESTAKGGGIETNKLGDGPAYSADAGTQWLDGGGLEGGLLFFGAHEKVADTLALRTLFITVIAGRLAVGTVFPISAVGGTGVGAIAARSGDGSATATVYDSTVVTRATAFGAMGSGEVSLKHVDMIRLGDGVHQCTFRLLRKDKKAAPSSAKSRGCGVDSLRKTAEEPVRVYKKRRPS